MGKEVKRYIATKTFPTHLSVQATNKDPVHIQDWSSSNNEIDMENDKRFGLSRILTNTRIPDFWSCVKSYQKFGAKLGASTAG